MKLPEFDDFRATLTDEKFMQYADEINRVVAIMEIPITPEAMQRMVHHTVSLSTQVALAMLRDYHEWLREQLSQDTLHLI